MATVRPFRAWRYSHHSKDISSLTAPPYDVISPSQRESLLAQSPVNAVALELPEGELDPATPGNRYETGANRWKQWMGDGTLEQDGTPAIYVLEQSWSVGEKQIRRKAFIAEVKLHDFEEGVVLPHERTLPKALGDRYALLEATSANFSAVFGLYPDPLRLTGAIFESAMTAEPIMTATDADGVLSRVWSLTDPETAQALASILADKNIFIADGHHRYTVALAHRNAMRKAAAASGVTSQDPAYDYVLMALVDMDDPELLVLPTHRIADALDGFSAEIFYSGLSEHFEVSDADDFASEPWRRLSEIDRPAFLVKTAADDAPKLAVLRESVDLSTVITGGSQDWKELDVTVLQELVLRRLFNIHPDEPESLNRLNFSKDERETLEMAESHDAVFIMRATKMSQKKAVSLAGDVMPQKSTYFYPKLPSGLVFRSAE